MLRWLPWTCAVALAVGGCSVAPGTELDASAPALDADAGHDGGLRDRRPPDVVDEDVDTDCDGLSDAQERGRDPATNPADPDTDGDGLLDGVEVGVRGAVPGSQCPPVADLDPSTQTDPHAADTDGDGLLDGVEDLDGNGAVGVAESDPNRWDTDGDSLSDGIEDANRDGRRDPTEMDPTEPDSDGDGLEDGIEDQDGDGRVGPGETSPLLADSDRDGVVDGDEDASRDGVRQRHESDPLRVDTDCDGLEDGRELTLGTAPWLADSDGDGVGDGVEAGAAARPSTADCPPFAGDLDSNASTDPTTPDTDGDGLADGVEDVNADGARSLGETDPNAADSDGEGVGDGIEVEIGADQLDSADPEAALRTPLVQLCEARALPQVVLHTEAGGWRLATSPSFVYTPFEITVAASGVRGAAFDDAARGLIGFVIELPVVPGASTDLVAQHQALVARISTAAGASGWTLTASSGASSRRYDGAEVITGARLDLEPSREISPTALRRNLLPWFTELPGASFFGVPNPRLDVASRFVVRYQLSMAPTPNRLQVLVGVLAAETDEDLGRDAGLVLDGLVGGGALAAPDARLEAGCRRLAVDGSTNAPALEPAAIPSTMQVGLRRGQGEVLTVEPSRRDGFTYSGSGDGLRLHGARAPLRAADLLLVGYRRWSDPPAPCPDGEARDPATGACDCDPDRCRTCGRDVCDASCACVCDRSLATRCGPRLRWDPEACACQ